MLENLLENEVKEKVLEVENAKDRKIKMIEDENIEKVLELA